MTKYLFAAALILLIFFWYLSFSASRLDRLHHRVETSWQHLDALLQRRASIALDIAHDTDLDPAMDILLTASAYESRKLESSFSDFAQERSEAESMLSESLKVLTESALAHEIDVKVKHLNQLREITEKVKIAIAVHLEAVNAVRNLRSKVIFRIFHLYGHAKLPFRYSFEDDIL
jgi:hypothetical protein